MSSKVNSLRLQDYDQMELGQFPSGHPVNSLRKASMNTYVEIGCF